MIFAELPWSDCAGAILAHSQRVGGGMFRKGRILSAADIAALRDAGHERVTVARLEPGDVGEDEAARQLAEALAGDGSGLSRDAAFAGRVNLHAVQAGVLALDATAVDALNTIDEAVTLATPPPFAALVPGQMAATIKIIPYAVPQALLTQALGRIATAAQPILRLHPYCARQIALIQTELAGTKPSVLAKTDRVMAERLAGMGQPAPAATRCGHTSAALQEAITTALQAGAGMILVIGASAISDRRDVIPAAITALGGHIDHFGMPVDPGNLLLLAHIPRPLQGGGVDRVPVLGLPGCARSPRLNGCDWVMQRLLAGLAVGADDIRALGVGGLLAEIPGRPQPREARPPEFDRQQSGRLQSGTQDSAGPKIAAIVLAAGRSSRMGRNKLLLDLDGKTIVAHVVDDVIGTGFAEIVVVTGHQAAKVKAALGKPAAPLKIVEARDHAEGMAASLKAGIRALSPTIDAAMVVLGDMPRVSQDLYRRIIAAYNPLEDRAIVLPVAAGKRGNPVLFDRRFFAEILRVEGDVGARHIIGANGAWVAEIPADPREIFMDVDTPEVYRQLLTGHDK